MPRWRAPASAARSRTTRNAAAQARILEASASPGHGRDRAPPASAARAPRSARPRLPAALVGRLQQAAGHRPRSGSAITSRTSPSARCAISSTTTTAVIVDDERVYNRVRDFVTKLMPGSTWCNSTPPSSRCSTPGVEQDFSASSRAGSTCQQRLDRVRPGRGAGRDRRQLGHHAHRRPTSRKSRCAPTSTRWPRSRARSGCATWAASS